MIISRVAQWANIRNTYLISPINGGDGRIIVEEDPPTSKFQCSDCGGAGHKGIVCKYCKGTRFDNGIEENGYCRDCSIGDNRTGAGKTLGFEPCPTCQGRGGTVIIPDESQSNTTMGTVIAISADGINCLKIRDKVLYTNYTGTQFKLLDIALRAMHEKDVIGKIKQLKPTADIIRHEPFAELENTGVPQEK